MEQGDHSRVDDLIPQLIREASLNLVKRPALTFSDLFQPFLEVDNCVFVCRLLQMLAYGHTIDIETLPVSLSLCQHAPQKQLETSQMREP